MMDTQQEPEWIVSALTKVKANSQNINPSLIDHLSTLLQTDLSTTSLTKRQLADLADAIVAKALAGIGK